MPLGVEATGANPDGHSKAGGSQFMRSIASSWFATKGVAPRATRIVPKMASRCLAQAWALAEKGANGPSVKHDVAIAASSRVNVRLSNGNSE
jgi:hypothetical protein